MNDRDKRLRRQPRDLVLVGVLAMVLSGCAVRGEGAFPGFEELFDQGRQAFYETLGAEIGPEHGELEARDASRIEDAQDRIPFLYEDLLNITYMAKAASLDAMIERGDSDSLAAFRREYLGLCRATAREFIRSLNVRSSGFERLAARVGNADRSALDLVLGTIGDRVVAGVERPARRSTGADLDLGALYRQSALTLAGFEAAHEITEAAGVKVAIVSTGIDLEHGVFVEAEIDLDHSLSLVGRRRPPWEKEEVALTDFDGRGTAMASIVHVFAPQAELRIYRIRYDPDPPYPYWAAMQLAQAIRRAATDGADVIAVDAGFDDDYEFLRAAVQFAYQQEAVIVAPNPSRPGAAVGTSKVFPARYNSVIAATGVLEPAPGQAVPWDAALPRHFTAVAAPATVLVAVPHRISEGPVREVTSDYNAVAVAASAVALVRSRVARATQHLPGEQVQRIYEILTSTCDPARVGFESFTPQVGYGLIDAAAAVGSGLAAYEAKMRILEEAQTGRSE